MGQAIIANAKETAKEAKKIHGLMIVAVNESILQKNKGGIMGFHQVIQRMTLISGY